MIITLCCEGRGFQFRMAYRVCTLPKMNHRHVIVGDREIHLDDLHDSIYLLYTSIFQSNVSLQRDAPIPV